MKNVTEETTQTAENQNLPAAKQDSAPATVATGKKDVQIVGMDEMTAAVEKAKDLGDVTKLQVGTINLKTEYLSFENPGESVRRVFLGFVLRQSVDPLTGEDKGLIPAAQLYDPTTETINVCMQTVLCGVLHEVGYPRGAALQITYKGDRKGKNGLKYQDFDIRALVPEKK
jgi:hypothetical protein